MLILSYLSVVIIITKLALYDLKLNKKSWLLHTAFCRCIWVCVMSKKNPHILALISIQHRKDSLDI